MMTQIPIVAYFDAPFITRLVEYVLCTACEDGDGDAEDQRWIHAGY